MLRRLLRLRSRRARTRLKAKDSTTSAKAKPAIPPAAVVVFNWFMVWLAAFLLQMTGRTSPRMELMPGQVAGQTVVASTEFDYTYSPDREQPSGLSSLFRPTMPDQRVTRHVSRGDTIVSRGDTVTRSTVAQLRSHNIQLAGINASGSQLFQLMGDGIMLLAGLLVSIGLLRLLSQQTLSTSSQALLFFVITIPTLIAAKWLMVSTRVFDVLPASTVDNLMPIALTPIMASILMGRRAAVVAGFWISYVIAVFANYSFNVFTTCFVTAMLITFISGNVRSRGRVLRIGSLAGLVGAALVMGVSLIQQHPWPMAANQGLASVFSGVFSALIALMLIPLLELMFGITTDMTLIELSTMEHPLLKRLALEAPGTYHHSLMVANLAQAGAAAIGADSLKAAAISYFHDIGKLTKPEFFSENIQFGDNPHDDISPHMSTLVIISHVKEGISLALQHKLPTCIVEAIQQHHGNSVVSYFHHKASKQLEMDFYGKGKGGATPVQEEDFRYPGPKPQTRETAILLLADSIEAASRSLEKTSPSSLESLVDDIIEAKRADGQFDNCPLTQSDMHAMRKAFLFTLTNMLHGRISYPSNENLNRQQSKPDENGNGAS